jgi:colicin import membrane protein
VAVDERALTELRSLAARDAELAERGAEIARRDAEVVAIRGRAEELEAALAARPAEQRSREAEVDEARAELERRREELAHAERVLEEAQGEEEREHERHAVDRASDHIAVAQARLDRAEAALADLIRQTQDIPVELEQLEARARGLAEAPDLAGSLAEWASRTHAEAFVAAGQIDTERERIIREANELATMLLGEPAYGSTPAQALARVEGLTSGEGRKH